MSSLSLSFFGLLVCVALCLANPLARIEEVTDLPEASEDTEGSLQPLDEIIAADYLIKQQHDIDEITPDHEEPMPNVWEDHNENLEQILGDSAELGNVDTVAENPLEVDHGVVKRDVEEAEDQDDAEVAEDEEHLEEETEDEEEHEVEKREVNEELVQWYRDAIDTNST